MSSSFLFLVNSDGLLYLEPSFLSCPLPFQVDLDNLNAREFPRTANLDFMDCVLEEGEMLYIPPKWWHYVRALSISFSVSFWWSAAGLPSEGI